MPFEIRIPTERFQSTVTQQKTLRVEGDNGAFSLQTKQAMTPFFFFFEFWRNNDSALTSHLVSCTLRGVEEDVRIRTSRISYFNWECACTPLQDDVA